MPGHVHSYSVIYHSLAGGGYAVLFPAIPGLRTQARTRERAMVAAQDLLLAYLRILHNKGEPMPREDQGMREKAIRQIRAEDISWEELAVDVEQGRIGNVKQQMSGIKSGSRPLKAAYRFGEVTETSLSTASIVVRAERTEDLPLVHAIHERAFGRRDEADLVDALRANGQAILSLVAQRNGTLVGHVLFSRVVIAGDPAFAALGLAPLAVDPDHQRAGVGSALVRTGLERARQLGCPAVVVLGHPEYYPRFGFRPAREHGLRCEFDAPEEAFMVVELQPGSLAGRSGVVRYRPEFRGF